MILDTNFLIYLDNNHPSAIKKAKQLENQDTPLKVPDIVVFELWVSVGKGSQPKKNRRELDNLVHGLPRVEATREIMKRAGEIEGTLQSIDTNGSGVGIADAVIAATALELEEPVLTDNASDFVRRIKQQAGETELEVISFLEDQ